MKSFSSIADSISFSLPSKVAFSSSSEGYSKRKNSKPSSELWCSVAFLKSLFFIASLSFSITVVISTSNSSLEVNLRDFSIPTILSSHLFALVSSITSVSSSNIACSKLAFALSTAACNLAALAKSRLDAASLTAFSAIRNFSTNSSIVGKSFLFLRRSFSLLWRGGHAL